MAMTQTRINAIVASAFNLAAAEEPSIRSVHANGMTPAIAATLPAWVRIGWLESYARRLNKLTIQQREAQGFLYDARDVQDGIDTLLASESGRSA